MQISSSPYKNVVPNSKQNYDSFPELEQQAPNHRSSRKFEKLSDRDHSSKKSTARKQEFSKSSFGLNLFKSLENSSLKQAQMINTDHFNSQDIKIIRPDDKTPKIEEEKNHKVVQDSHIFQVSLTLNYQFKAKQVIHTFGIQPEEGEPLKSPQFNEYEQEFDLEVTEVNNLRNGSKLDVFITDDHGSFNIDSDNNIRIPVNSQAPGTNDDSYYNSVNTSSGKIAFIEGNQVINPESSYSLSKNMSNKRAFNGRADSL